MFSLKLSQTIVPGVSMGLFGIKIVRLTVDEGMESGRRYKFTLFPCRGDEGLLRRSYLDIEGLFRYGLVLGFHIFPHFKIKLICWRPLELD